MTSPRHQCFFVLQRGDETHLLTYRELNKDWYTAGFEVVDWFKACNRSVARVEMGARKILSRIRKIIAQDSCKPGIMSA